MPRFYIERGDGFTHTIERVPTDDDRSLLDRRHFGEDDTFPSKEAALNAWIGELIDTREKLSAAIAAAQKKQRRWDQRNDGRN